MKRTGGSLGVVQEVYPGRDGVVRAVQVKTANRYLERAIQHPYPLELSCGQEPTTTTTSTNGNFLLDIYDILYIH